MTKIKNILIRSLLVFLLFCSINCSFLNKENKLKEQEDMKLKQEKIALLRKNLSAQTFKKGIKASNIEDQFGKPDAVFKSGSSVSSFEIWTYGHMNKKEKFEDWQPIRLYFDNDILINWKY